MLSAVPVIINHRAISEGKNQEAFVATGVGYFQGDSPIGRTIGPLSLVASRGHSRQARASLEVVELNCKGMLVFGSKNGFDLAAETCRS